MKTLKTVALALTISAFSLSAFAATEITREQVKANNYQKVGVVTVTNGASSAMDAKRMLSKKADEQGGKYFVIIAEDNKNKESATADVYK